MQQRQPQGQQLESRPNGCHVPVQAAFRAPDVQGQGPLEQAGEDLDLVRTAVFGYFKPLHQKLYPDVMWGHLWWTGPWLALL